MSDTPARDALAAAFTLGSDPSMVYADDVVAWLTDNPDLLLAALIESGWTPTDDDLRAMGGSERPSWEYGSLWRFPSRG